ncbi:MAG: thioredoxin family protein [Phycisphaeraceae bacterium]|nr:thioredoxin family protein [Phycisphaeraceae bacterium]
MSRWVMVLLWCAVSVAFADGGRRSLDVVVDRLVSGDTAVATAAATDLRDAGDEGLQAILRQYDHAADNRLVPWIDFVAGQHDAVWSRLYWYTDLNSAKSAARAQRKPILYLRLLGRLTDEYSCANSRFFRTVLYANRNVSALLRDRFILIWESERPAPMLTVDFGDGRVLKRTVTGNSAHFILDSDGNVIDALPGLFDPAAFARILKDAADAATSGPLPSRTYAQKQRDHLSHAWQVKTGTTMPPAAPAGLRLPDAVAAGRVAMTKMEVEAPLLGALSPGFRALLTQPDLPANIAMLDHVASLHMSDAALDDRSIGLIKRQNPAASDDEMRVMVKNLEWLIAADSVRNNYMLRYQVLEWIAASPRPIQVQDLSRRVYDELFLTPRSDPWLGLSPEGAYSALAHDGRKQMQRR